MTSVCVKCVKDNNLKTIVILHGKSGTCHLCNEKNTVIDSQNNDFFQLVKATIRFNYSEWEYNHHLGGENIESIIGLDENILFNNERALNPDDYSDFVHSLFCDGVYEEYTEGVSLFAGHDAGGMQNMPLRSIKTDLSRELIEIHKQLKHKNYFVFEDEVKTILQTFQKVATETLKANTGLYRARIGCKESKKHLSLTSGFELERHYKPFSGNNIGATPVHLAPSGRINRAGVSYLYCATDKNTAVAEVRPHPGDIVSTGVFITGKELKLYNLSDEPLLHFYKSDEQLDKYRVFNTLSVLINKTIPPSERSHYSITQLLADCIRQIEFDGIRFSSSVGDGDNIVIFDDSNVQYTDKDASVIFVSKVVYSHHELPKVDENEHYMSD